MELTISTRQILRLLQILSWIIFIGLCVQAGGIIFSAVYSFAINPANTRHFWEGLDLSELYRYDAGQFIVMVIFMTIVAVLKAILFYMILKLFVEKKLSIKQPFSTGLRRFLITASCLTLGIGLFAHSGDQYSKWLSSQGVTMPDPQSLDLSGADVWLFMAVVLLVVAQVVKRGIEIQAENDLTI